MRSAKLSSGSNNSKTPLSALTLVAGAATTLVGAAVLYHFFFSSASEQKSEASAAAGIVVGGEDGGEIAFTSSAAAAAAAATTGNSRTTSSTAASSSNGKNTNGSSISNVAGARVRSSTAATLHPSAQRVQDAVDRLGAFTLKGRRPTVEEEAAARAELESALDAARIALKANRTDKTQFIEDQRQLADALSEAGFAIYKCGRVLDAQKLLTEATFLFRELLYLRSDETTVEEKRNEDVAHANCLTNRGTLLEDLDEKREALVCHKTALDMCFHHFDTQRSVSSFSKEQQQQILMQQQQSQAQQQQEGDAAASTTTVTLRVDNRTFAKCMNNMGALMFNLGQRETGMYMLQASFDMRKRLSGGLDDADLAESMLNIGMIMEKTESSKRHGIVIMQVAFQMYQRIHGGMDHPVVAQCLNSLGAALIRAGESGLVAVPASSTQREQVALSPEEMEAQKVAHIEQGLALQREGVDVMKRFCNGRDDTGLVQMMNEVGSAFGSQGFREEGLEMKLEALDMARRLYGNEEEEEEDEAAAEKDDVGKKNVNNGNDDSNSISGKKRKTDHPQLALALYNCGVSLFTLERKDEGIAMFRKSAAMQRRIANGKDNVRLANSLKVLGVAMVTVGQKEEGERLQQEAKEMQERILTAARARGGL